VRSETGRQAERDHLDDASEGVSFRCRGVDLRHHRLRRLLVEAANRRRVDRIRIVRRGSDRLVLHDGRAYPNDV
jgi:hypothetical protein